jgi:branched-chain amino acid transport system permease protein
VIGGLGSSLWGALLGGVVLGIAQSIGGQINPEYSVLAGHLVFLAVLASPRGGLLTVGGGRVNLRALKIPRFAK